MSKKTALVLLAEGTEEMEFVITVDVLRRAGIAVTVAGVEDNTVVKCSRDVTIVPDTSLNDAVKKCSYDVVVLPGGLVGAKKFAESQIVGDLLKKQESSGSLVAAICAAPIALQTHGVFQHKKLTSYPSFKEKLEQQYKYSEDRVMVDGNLITSRGPGTAFDFALTIADELLGNGASEPVKKAMLFA